MTVQDIKPGIPAGQPVPILPESAPFEPSQRAWLNGFFAGLLSVEAQPGVLPVTGGLPAPAQNALADEDTSAPWHDPAMGIDERMKLAEDKPLKRKLFAAMAQQDCGQCGYVCDTYADALAAGLETKQNLCAPGGKETSRMLKKLMEATPSVPADSAAAAASAVKPAKDPGKPGYGRDVPVDATFLSATRITGAASEKDARHIVFDLSESGVDYVPGDSFGLMPTNDPALADAILAAMRAPADFPITGGKTFRNSLIEDYALGAAPDMLFELVSYIVGGDRRKKAKALAKGQDPDGDAAQYDVLAVLEKFGPIHPDPEAFLECLEPLQPRLYSISSSPLATPGQLHLTVDAVRFPLGGRLRLGVASTFLADRLKPGTPVKVYVQKAHGFGLPPDPATPIIMVGPGTGVAPFRSFLWHREAQRAQGVAVGKSWLFFGHQRESTDFFYRSELEQLASTGALTTLTTAWSRDGEAKVYVQDRMREHGADLWKWLKAGAHVYICGDAKRMAKDVETALAEIAADHGTMSPAGAKDFIVELKSAGRYQADVY
ncbi:MAG: sulfite reductase subunit alpha [Hyphomicrobiaceae bacterium]